MDKRAGLYACLEFGRCERARETPQCAEHELAGPPRDREGGMGAGWQATGAWKTGDWSGRGLQRCTPSQLTWSCWWGRQYGSWGALKAFTGRTNPYLVHEADGYYNSRFKGEARQMDFRL
jgi:hypothetical protein